LNLPLYGSPNSGLTGSFVGRPIGQPTNSMFCKSGSHHVADV
jgi:hypothetical protein